MLLELQLGAARSSVSPSRPAMIAPAFALPVNCAVALGLPASRTVLVREGAFLGLVAFDHQRGPEAGLDVGELGCQRVGLAADLVGVGVPLQGVDREEASANLAGQTDL